MPPQIIPVIHYADDDQAMRNAVLASDAGCDGVMLIHMEGRNRLLSSAATAIKERWPDLLVGINHLGWDADDSVRSNIADGLDMTWTDEQLTHSGHSPWERAGSARGEVAGRPAHLLFSGVAFKHQEHEPLPGDAARRAVAYGFIPTTSGSATGVAANAGDVARLRDEIGPNAPLAIASGITPGNVRDFAPYLTHILVATGVSASFHEFDAGLLADLVSEVRRI